MILSFTFTENPNPWLVDFSVLCNPFFFFQVLPDDMIVLAEPAPGDMVRAVKKAIDMLPGIDPQIMHLRVSLNSQHSTPYLNSGLYHCYCVHFALASI
jgi:hypothetical protein